MVEKLRNIWLNGTMIDWDKAQVHVLAHALHYGTSVFEGIRCYEIGGNGKIWKLSEHIDRFFHSAKMLKLKIPYSKQEIIDACEELIKVNNVSSCYIRPLAFLDYGPMGLDTRESPVSVAIIAWPWGAYFADGLEKGIKIAVCPYTRRNNELSSAKIGGSYYESVLAKRWALDHSYDEALMLDDKGAVAEGSGENLFFFSEGNLVTPALGAILPGITRQAVIDIAKELGYPVEERVVKLSEVKESDESFFTGTAAEVTPICEVEGSTIGDGTVGEHTKRIKDSFFEKVKKI